MQKRYDVELRKELSNLKEDMARLSMVDEFAKYAKLQRRYNHMENILKENGESQYFSLHVPYQVKTCGRSFLRKLFLSVIKSRNLFLIKDCYN